jgi:hypothetical protein
MIVNLGVKDFRNFKFQFSIDFDWRRRRLDMVRNGVWSCDFELGNMEDRMYSAHGVQKMEGEGLATNFGDDLERTQIFFR